MQAPKISVIVPLFKTEKYVEKCLRSIMSQTFTDFEILCVDDCSPDGSAAIVERLAKEDPRIVLIRHSQNLGLGGARNTAIRAARADYIASVDSDDYIEEGMLAALWEGTKGGYYDVVVCGYARVDENGEVLSRHQASKVKIVDPIPDDQSPFNISNPAFWNKLWRRSLYVDNDIFFPNHIYHQDSATTPRIYKKARNVRFIGGEYYRYLVRGDSATNSTSDKHLLDRFRELDTVKGFFLKEGLYQKHKEDFRERIFKGYSYHAENVYANRNGGDEATDRYLRHLLLMREAYLMLDDTIRGMSLEEKVAALQDRQALLPDSGSANPQNASSAQSFKPALVPVLRNASAEYPKRPPLPAHPRVLILTIYAGENELDQCQASLASQTYRDWDQTLFQGMGKAEAHHKLYSTIMENRDRYDLFLKLDADMLLSNEGILQDIIDQFRQIDDLDHITIACDDFMTGTQILGVHTFSNRVTWERNENELFTDPKPQRPGRRINVPNPPYSFFQHSPDPSPLQAFHFGAHRALKLVQRGYSVEQKRVDPMQTQWETLVNTWHQFKAHGDRRHALALFAADLVVNGQIGDKAYDYSDPSLIAAYEKYALYTSEKLKRALLPNWEDEAARERYFRQAVGPEGLEKLALHEKEKGKKRKALAAA